MLAFRNAGIWLLGAGIELLLMVHVSELLYPGYSVSDNYISDLGVGPSPSREVFMAGLVVFGLMALTAAYLLRRSGTTGHLWWMVAASGVGAIGVAVFDENSFLVDGYPVPHSIFALTAFLLGNIAVVYSSRFARAPLSWLWAALGAVGLVALVLFTLGAQYRELLLGLGIGGMERMIFYPAMFWTISMGTALVVGERPLELTAVGQNVERR